MRRYAILPVAIALVLLTPAHALFVTRAMLPGQADENTPRTRVIKAPVLLYHYVREPPPHDRLGSSLSISPSAFRDHLSHLTRHGYVPISPEQFLEALEGKAFLPTKPVLLSFDDGTVDFVLNAFPLLQAYGIPATVFVIPGFVGSPGYMSWEDIQRIARSPLITIGSHGLNHVQLPSLEEGTAYRQLILSRNLLIAMTGQRVEPVAYPYGAYTPSTISSARRAGYKLGFTTERGDTHLSNQRLRLPRVRAGAFLTALE